MVPTHDPDCYMTTPKQLTPVETVSAQVDRGTARAHKSHGFDESHDPSLPAQQWFQETHEGLVLFLVLYSQACRWSRCLGCNLPSKMSRGHVPFDRLMAQIDHALLGDDVQSRRAEIRKVIASNNGSLLDQSTFSSTALMYLIARLNSNLPALRTLSLETRPEYVEMAELEFLSRGLAEGPCPTILELAIGFEAFDDRIRNEVFDKGLPLAAFERLVQKVAPYGYHLKCYFMLKPVPGLSDDDAVADIADALDYLDGLALEYGVALNMHLNPTYVARGTPLEAAYHRGEYSPPRLSDLARAALHGRGKSVSLYLGLSDEGLAVEGGSFVRPGEGALVERLEAFNRTQDYGILEEVVDDWCR